MREATQRGSVRLRPAATRPAWQRGRFWLQWGLTALLGALIVWRLDIPEAWRVIKSLQPGWLLLGIVALIASNFVHALKWEKLLECVGKTRVRDLFAVFWSSMATNNVIPFRAGDFLRVQVLSQRTGLSRSGIVASLFTETILDGVAFAVILLAGIVLLSGGGRELYITGTILSLAVLAMMVATVAAARVKDPQTLGSFGPFRWLSPRFRRLLEGVLPDFIEGLRPLGSWRSGLVVTAWSLFAWMLEVLAYVAFGYAFRLEVPLGAYFVVMVAVNVSASITILPSNLGVYEFAAISILRATGASAGEATAYAIGTHVLVILTISGVGLLTLAYLHIGPGDIFYVRRRSPAPAPVMAKLHPQMRRARGVPHYGRLDRQGRH